MKRKSILLARLMGDSPVKRACKERHQSPSPPPPPATKSLEDDTRHLSSSQGAHQLQQPLEPTKSPPLLPRAVDGAAVCLPASVPLSRAPKTAAVEVTLVRPPITPSAYPMPDGARADAAERGFYAAWGLSARRSEQPLHRRNPGPNPVSVSLAALRDLNPDEYVVAEKTDGVRYALLLCGDETGSPMAVMVDRAGRKFEVAVRAAARFFAGAGTLLDGELAWERPLPHVQQSAAPAPRPITVDLLVGAGGTHSGVRPSLSDQHTTGDAGARVVEPQATAEATTTPGETLVYWVFDAVRVAGVSQRDADYETRIELVQRLIEGREADDLIEAAADANAHGLAFRAKPCVPARLVDSVWSADAPRLRHGSDGLILTPLRDPIRMGTHWRQFKWKHRHTLDLQLRGRRRDDGTWLWGLYYLEADWTVPTADALAAGGTRSGVAVAAGAPPAAPTALGSSPPSASSTAPDKSDSGGAADDGAPSVMCARYLNACEGILYRRSDVARASRDRASAARTSARHGRRVGTGRSPPVAPHEQRQRASAVPEQSGGASEADDAECLVVFVLQKDAALDALVERVLRQRPTARRIKCVVECEAAFVAPPPGWRPPPDAPPGGVRLLRCAIERLRTDKTDPNVRYTVRQTLLNIDEAIAYATVRAALCRPRAPIL
ncbi:mRNA capping enzyme, catalytic domain containing protein [Pandoravirus macleodensis]|uniref:mRNA capping enzyme, catalytic domain containing protein n=1 Tax=Pandoravirus macleodensis TaxID=2107707 RepID=A0A2U7UEY9_9VIRU|nr:mRNA capping enzyme, catalytic domain containing protein [Pandoravirus macleodensis]AVK77013.1 mRNA capping enzyme, catalytic domain containing protein [Pandoravirus macleodensis]